MKQHARVHSFEGSVRGTTYTIRRRDIGCQLAGRVLIAPGLFGTELAYAETAEYMAAKLPFEVVTMEHSRSPGNLLSPMQARSKSCKAVMEASMSHGKLPNYYIGHSLAGADVTHLAEYVDINLIAGIGLETSVGLSERRPEVISTLGFVKDSMLQLPSRLVADAVQYVGRNPALAAAEIVHARHSDIRSSLASLGSLVLHEAYNAQDTVIHIPEGREGITVRDGYNHLAICLHPEIGLEHADKFMEHVETSRQAA